MTGLFAAVLTAAAVGAALPWRPRLREGQVRRPPLVGAVVVGGALVAAGNGAAPMLVVLGTGLAVALLREVRRRRERTAAERRSVAVLTVCDGLAADLKAGLPPVAALRAGVAEWPEFGSVADAAVLGADVPGALRVLAQLAGAEQLRLVAAAWTVSHRSGAGLAGAIGLAARTIREERSIARVVETELASARATARLLALLPVGVLLIGRGAGGDPFGFLFGTPAGAGCLTVGLLLSWLGLQWLERIADGVRRG
ncbi:MAG TPA: type II secretion system F family protein [Marmoricola sp.]|jgi:tight adherence protein B|nr:type II secretion system F family protein [Marmoricola sp.]